MRRFADFPHLKVIKQSNKSVIILYNPALSADNGIKRANFDQHSIIEAAYYLRGLLKDQEKNTKNLPEPLSADIVAKGQAEPPDELHRFFRVLYTGSTDMYLIHMFYHHKNSPSIIQYKQ